ncbi:MAG TPA: alpha/beta hydrolase [Pseudonocardia sp.]|nr:alpha/beta hydrolase [Pseudonocardia sp.]
MPNHVTAPDGTRIAYWTSGDGPPLVMAHGAMADHTTLVRLVPLLEPHFTVHAVDRRGRGASGDGPEYSVEHEYDDLAAVVDSVAQRTGAPVALYGHSYGATCALGAALRTGNVHRLALYEPAFRGVFHYPPGLLDRLDALVAQGRSEDAVELAFRERVGASAADVEAMRALPSWPARVAAAPTIPRELRVDATLDVDPARYAPLRTPTVLLLGERSPAGQRAVVSALDAALPDGRTVSLPGQEHLAQLTAPELVARELIRAAAQPSLL